MGVKHLPTLQGHTPPTFMGLLRNCYGPTSTGLSLFNLHYALEISSTRGAPMSVPVPLLLPPNLPKGCNLGQRLMAFSSQAGKSFSGSTVPSVTVPRLVMALGLDATYLSSGSSAVGEHLVPWPWLSSR